MAWYDPRTWFASPPPAPAEEAAPDEPVSIAFPPRDGLARLQRLLAAVSEGLAAAEEMDRQAAPAPLADPAAAARSLRNRVLAGAGEKAEMFGTLTTAPTLAAEQLVELGLTPEAAADVIDLAAEARQKALELDSVADAAPEL
jgi:hypothetical protein